MQFSPGNDLIPEDDFPNVLDLDPYLDRVTDDIRVKTPVAAQENLPLQDITNADIQDRMVDIPKHSQEGMTLQLEWFKENINTYVYDQIQETKDVFQNKLQDQQKKWKNVVVQLEKRLRTLKEDQRTSTDLVR